LSAYADASALVKLYADEPHCEPIRELSDLVVSQLARVEVPAALWRKHRDASLPAEAAGVLSERFAADYHGWQHNPPRFAVVAVSEPLLDSAAGAAVTHGLRAFDAVQLASALAARVALPDLSGFAAFDRALRRAAAAEGFTVIPDVA
jgi:uncharacterized protein